MRDLVKAICKVARVDVTSVGNTDVKIDGQTVNVDMIGNDEMYDADDFYQLGVTADGKILKMFFEIPEGTDDMSNVDYSIATRVEDATDEYMDLID